MPNVHTKSVSVLLVDCSSTLGAARRHFDGCIDVKGASTLGGCDLGDLLLHHARALLFVLKPQLEEEA